MWKGSPCTTRLHGRLSPVQWLRRVCGESVSDDREAGGFGWSCDGHHLLPLQCAGLDPARFGATVHHSHCGTLGAVVGDRWSICSIRHASTGRPTRRSVSGSGTLYWEREPAFKIHLPSPTHQQGEECKAIWDSLLPRIAQSIQDQDGADRRWGFQRGHGKTRAFYDPPRSSCEISSRWG